MTNGTNTSKDPTKYNPIISCSLNTLTSRAILDYAATLAHLRYTKGYLGPVPTFSISTLRTNQAETGREAAIQRVRTLVFTVCTGSCQARHPQAQQKTGRYQALKRIRQWIGINKGSQCLFMDRWTTQLRQSHRSSQTRIQRIARSRGYRTVAKQPHRKLGELAVLDICHWSHYTHCWHTWRFRACLQL